jgi:hypothetical protein
VQLTLDLSVDVDSSAHLIYALPAEERERAYGRLRRLKLMDAIRSGFASDLAHRIAENGSERTRGLVLGLCAAADLTAFAETTEARGEAAAGQSPRSDD